MDDNFWRFIYEDLAYGKVPYGLYIQDNYLCCYIKNKEFSYKITNNSDSLDELHSLLRKRAGILSEKDRIHTRENLYNQKITEMHSINKKNYRDNLIQNYVICQGKKNNIKLDILKNLLMFLNNAFLFKVISLNDITFDNQSIESIKGILFKKNKIIIKYNLFSNVNNISIVEDEIKKQNIIQLWKIFIDEMKES
tara:strand:+ start:1456 stop:2040 length:585 start_codon:yes stop_codon:yes gene_type:complete